MSAKMARSSSCGFGKALTKATRPNIIRLIFLIFFFVFLLPVCMERGKIISVVNQVLV